VNSYERQLRHTMSSTETVMPIRPKIRGARGRRDRGMKKPIELRMPARKGVSLTVMLSLAILPQPLYAMPPSGGDTVRALYDALLAQHDEGRAHPRWQWTVCATAASHTEDLRPADDGSLVGRTVLGHRDRCSATANGRNLRPLYCGAMLGSVRQLFGTKTEEQPAPSGVIVRTRIVKASGKPVEVDYLLRQNGQSW
jgi:ABC-type transporter MlaC component